MPFCRTLGFGRYRSDLAIGVAGRFSVRSRERGAPNRLLGGQQRPATTVPIRIAQVPGPAVAEDPPPTKESVPLAVLLEPPPTNERTPPAMLLSPPPTKEFNPLAALLKPPPIYEWAPWAVLSRPPPTRVMLTAVLDRPPPLLPPGRPFH